MLTTDCTPGYLGCVTLIQWTGFRTEDGGLAVCGTVELNSVWIAV